MDPIIVSALVSSLIREAANIMDRSAKGEITDADIDMMLTALGSKADKWAAEIAAKKAAQA
jgi:hypothetical protein